MLFRITYFYRKRSMEIILSMIWLFRHKRNTKRNSSQEIEAQYIIPSAASLLHQWRKRNSDVTLCYCSFIGTSIIFISSKAFVTETKKGHGQCNGQHYEQGAVQSCSH